MGVLNNIELTSKGLILIIRTNAGGKGGKWVKYKDYVMPQV